VRAVLRRERALVELMRLSAGASRALTTAQVVPFTNNFAILPAAPLAPRHTAVACCECLRPNIRAASRRAARPAPRAVREAKHPAAPLDG
jgi:hypothetical protein